MSIGAGAGGAFASFRDPAGRVAIGQGRVIRKTAGERASQLARFLQSEYAPALVAEGSLVPAKVIEFSEVPPDLIPLLGEHTPGDLYLEHEPVFIPSYPYEWPAEMLAAAGRLTLSIFRRLLRGHIGLKDATPYNVLFHGPRPVFVDWNSFEDRNPNDGTWLAYSQFVNTFILPLLLHKYANATISELLLSRRDGIEPLAAFRRLGALDRFRPACLPYVTFPALLSGAAARRGESLYRPRLYSQPAKAQFVLEAMLANLERALGKLGCHRRNSAWAGYEATQKHYGPRQLKCKLDFVSAALAHSDPGVVLDIGCNTGTFAKLAAENPGRHVLAIDSDPVAVGKLWESADAGYPNITCLVVDVTRPTPATGWRNRENVSFLQRVRGVCDMVMMLAVVHHMVVSERVPFSDIVSLMSDLTTKWAIVEFVDHRDPLFRALTRGRDHLHQDLGQSKAERIIDTRFHIVRFVQIPDTLRWLYLLRKRQ